MDPNRISQPVMEPLSVSGELSAPPDLKGLRLGMGSTEIAEALLSQAQDSFSRFHGMAFSAALDPAFLSVLQTLCRQATFVPEISRPGTRSGESPKRAGAALDMALSRAPFLRWLEQVSGCGPLEKVDGRVVQTSANTGEELRWHDDRRPGRKLAIVLNLSEAPFVGGGFEMRLTADEMKTDAKNVLEYQHEAAGSLLIFAVCKELIHRVLPITAGGPRRVFAGWAFSNETE